MIYVEHIIKLTPLLLLIACTKCVSVVATVQLIESATFSSQQSIIRGIAIITYVPKLSEKLKLILLRHGIRTVFKTPKKLGGLLSSFKNAIAPGYRQGAIYKINCSDCDQCYIGETKRWFETRKKEHMRDVKNGDNNATALSKHAVELGHSIDWKNYKILQLETGLVPAIFGIRILRHF